jgi:DNA-binding NtrC family response regulator
MEGRQHLRSPRSIDLLLTDVMPQMRGDELAAHIGSSRRETRVLYMSGYMDRTVVRNSMAAVGSNFIQKPFSTGSLLTKIRQVLSQAVQET